MPADLAHRLADSPTSAPRTVRLVLQPLLVLWALWSTGAWKAWRRAGRR